MAMKGLLRMFTQGDRCTLLAGASGKHVEKFGHFKEFLGGNRNALRALAELEMLYYSGQSFTAADIAFQYEQLFGQVRSPGQCAEQPVRTPLCPAQSASRCDQRPRSQGSSAPGDPA
jgi:hypothetical protein